MVTLGPTVTLTSAPVSRLAPPRGTSRNHTALPAFDLPRHFLVTRLADFDTLYRLFMALFSF